jgi:gamma-glutamyltranspeptidase/glutathione hydrolase
VELEERFPQHVRSELTARGHELTLADAWSMSVGGAHAIQFDADQGVFHGGADPRRDGYAAGW